MSYLDKELLEAKRKLEYQKHTTLESGMYAGEKLITFKQKGLFDDMIRLPLPDQFVVMPDSIKSVKYPSQNAPAVVMTTFDTTVNLTFNLLPILLKEGEIKAMSGEFQNALMNVNPSVIVKNQTDTKTKQGNEISWFEYKWYHLDDQSYNRNYLLQMRKTVLYATFSCNIKDKNNWIGIINEIFLAVEESL